MKTRYKTYSEFTKQILIVEITEGALRGGVSIICRQQSFVILKTKFKPWNSKQTKRCFLSKLYFKEVLCKHVVSQLVPRIEDYQWLGRRVSYQGSPFVVVDGWEGAHKDTGEVLRCLRIFPLYPSLNISDVHPIDVTETEIKIE